MLMASTEASSWNICNWKYNQKLCISSIVLLERIRKFISQENESKRYVSDSIIGTIKKWYRNSCTMSQNILV